MKHIVYVLKDPRDMRPYYVGCTINPIERMHRHNSLNKNDQRNKFLKTKSIIDSGMKPIFEEVCFSESRLVALKIEENLTNDLRSYGFDLVNELSGRSMSQITGEKIRQSHIISGVREKRIKLLAAASVRKRIKVKDDLGNYYESISEASKKTGCATGNIKKVLTGEYSQCNGRKFFYV